MELQDRNLSVNMRGDDVALLNRELAQFDYQIPDNEVQEHVCGKDTRKAVLDFQRKNDLDPTGRVDETTAARINQEIEARQIEKPFVVKGTVREADSKPFVGGLVRAYDKDLRSEELLGEKPTNEMGQYEIRYNAEQFRRAEKGSADLQVRAFDSNGKELQRSEIRFNAGPEETIDVLLEEKDLSLSEYERLLDAIAPVLGGIAPRELKEADIDFIAGDTGIERQRIAWLADSARRDADLRRFHPGLELERV